MKNIAVTLLALTVLTSTVLTQAKNGCTEGKCTNCARSTTTGKESNRYCTSCYDSLLTITTTKVDQHCEGSSTGTDDCQMTAYDSSYEKVVCTMCDSEYSLRRYDTNKTVACYETKNECHFGNFNEMAESCWGCEEKERFVIHQVCKKDVPLSSCVTADKVWAFKCEPDGIELEGCEIKTTNLGQGFPSSASTTFREQCAFCKSGWHLKSDGTCIEHFDQINKYCHEEQAFTNLCRQCNWFHNDFAVGSSRLSASQGISVNRRILAAAPGEGDQFCD